MAKVKTVAELRAECKALGLPTYQVKGRKLRKADLERQLAACQVKAAESVKAKPIYNELTQAEIYDFARSRHAHAAKMTTRDMAEYDSLTMHRIMRDCATPSEHRHWDVRAYFISQVASG